MLSELVVGHGLWLVPREIFDLMKLMLDPGKTESETLSPNISYCSPLKLAKTFDINTSRETLK